MSREELIISSFTVQLIGPTVGPESTLRLPLTKHWVQMAQDNTPGRRECQEEEEEEAQDHVLSTLALTLRGHI